MRIIALARSRGIDTIAEGVERPEQARELQAAGCALAQGFFCSRPLDADVITQLAATRRPDLPLTAASAVNSVGA